MIHHELESIMVSLPVGRIFHLWAFTILFAAYTAKGTNYKDGQTIPMYVNKVGPYFNPQETYHYYSLPVCRPVKVEHRSLTLGEVLDGDRMAVAMYEIKFRESAEEKTLCTVKLNEQDVQRLRNAIEDLYYFEFVLDDLPLRGFIGHLEEGGFLPHHHKIFMWKHLNFNIQHNGDQIIVANVSTANHQPVSLEEVQAFPLEVMFTYSVSWRATKCFAVNMHEIKQKALKVALAAAIQSIVPYHQRSKLKGDGTFFPKNLQIHWLSIINSVVLVFLLIGFVIIILMRVLKNDFARYNFADEEDVDEIIDSDEVGWKIIHADVFRFPKYKSFFCAILGVGSQFLTLCFGIMFMALLGLFNVHRHGSMNTAAVLLYALTCCVSGYISSNFYRKIGGTNWVWNVVLTTSLFSVPFFVIWSVINSVAWGYQSTQALPYTTIILLMVVWLIVGFPLTILGGIFGKNWASSFDAPCRTKNIPREIPPIPWYRDTFVRTIIGGFLPFSATSVELYYIFSTLWGREQYTLYGILFLAFVILLSVTACIAIALTYFQLSSEDYRWWWRSIFSGGSSGVFVFFYSLFYYYRRSNMSGVLQSVQFFGYTLLACYVFSLMLGTVSFFASLKFIRYIYVNLKMD